MTLFFLLHTLAGAADVDRVPEDFPNIQAAVDHGTAPMIEVGPGRWDGAAVDRPVALIGRPGAIVDRGVRVRGGARAAFALGANADRSEVSGFEIDCEGPKLDLGVYGSVRRFGGAADAVTVSQNTFVGCVQGVTNTGSPTRSCTSPVDGGAYWVVQGNTFDGFSTRSDAGGLGGGIGVYLFNVAAADVLDNRFVGQVSDRGAFSTTGVALSGCVDCTVAANEFAVAGGDRTWTAVANLGASHKGGGPSSGLILSDNDASADSAPLLGISFRSHDSQGVELFDNSGSALVDHDRCGDGQLEVVE